MTRLTIEYTNTTCRCGCKQVLISKKSRFAQGHDARFVSNLRQEAIDSDKGLHAEITLVDGSTNPASQSMVSVSEAVERLGSPALKDKLVGSFHKEQGRIAERGTREAKAMAARLAKAEAKARTPKEGKPAKAQSSATAKAGVTLGSDASAPIDLDTLAPTTEPAVEGEKPVAHKNGGRTRRGSLNSQS